MSDFPSGIRRAGNAECILVLRRRLERERSQRAAPAAQSHAQLDRTSNAFGLSAAITCILNTLLAWIKDAYEPLNSFMASLTGHHWTTTHGLADVLLFTVIGFVLTSTSIPERIGAKAVTTTLVASVVLSGLGLLAWFMLF